MVMVVVTAVVMAFGAAEMRVGTARLRAVNYHWNTGAVS